MHLQPTIISAIVALASLASAADLIPHGLYNGLLARQVSTCPKGYQTCDTNCSPSGYVCCGNGAGAFCPPNYYCTTGSNGQGGCCPNGERCEGDGGTSTVVGTITSTFVVTSTSTTPPQVPSPDPIVTANSDTDTSPVVTPSSSSSNSSQTPDQINTEDQPFPTGNSPSTPVVYVTPTFYTRPPTPQYTGAANNLRAHTAGFRIAALVALGGLLF